MPCGYPQSVSVRKGSIVQTFTVPCGRCLNCRLARSRALLCVSQAELQSVYKRGLGASFVTLTYSDDNLPENGSLRKVDFQGYLKRLRIAVDRAFDKKIKAKYLACGEYGDRLGRPHYHVVFLGYSTEIVNSYLDKWPFGISYVLPLKPGGLRYVAKYCMKQVFGKLKDEMYTDKGLEAPFITHSVNLGDEYFMSHLDSFADDNFMILRNGKRVLMPKYLREKYGAKVSFDSMSVLFEMHKMAIREGFDSVQSWQKYSASISERSIANSLRADGVAVEYHGYIGSSVSADYIGKLVKESLND